MSITAEELIDSYLEAVDGIKPRGPRKKSLAQKQGARAAGRTRTRRQYHERVGYLMHNYFYNAVGSNVNNP